MTLERQCLLSMYVESSEGVVNINLRLAKKLRKVCVRVRGYEFSLKRTILLVVKYLFSFTRC